jgi:ABC-type proline/glycine betaine transport system substrate-binding protein
MNRWYDFRYLEDPKDALGELNTPARILTIVNEALPEDDPVAYASMGVLTFNEDQLNDLESTINEADDPLEGATRGRAITAASDSPGSRPPRTHASLKKGLAHYAKLPGSGE